jgi:DNA-directed RNA polymerase specialized sigma24 family protein
MTMIYANEEDALTPSAEEQAWSVIEVDRLMSKLSEREKFVIAKRLEGYTFKEIGAMCGVGKDRVIQNLAKAFRIMRRCEYDWEMSTHTMMGGSEYAFRRYCHEHGFAPPSDHSILVQ